MQSTLHATGWRIRLARRGEGEQGAPAVEAPVGTRTVDPAAHRVGSHEAFDRLWTLHEGHIRGLVQRAAAAQGLSEQIEDVLQEVRLALWQAMYQDSLFTTRVYLRGATRAWLQRVAHHKLVDAVRRRKRQADRPLSETFDATGDEAAGDALLDQLLGAPDHHDPALVVLRHLHGQATLVLLTRAMQALPAGQREALVLVVIHQHSYAEAARHLGVREGTVKSQVSEARAKLRRLLDAWDGPSELHGQREAAEAP